MHRRKWKEISIPKSEVRLEARSWPVQDRTGRSRTGSKTGRSGLQYWARENVGPVRSLTEPLGRTEGSLSPPPPFLVVADTGSPLANYHVPELPHSFLPLLPVRRIFLPPVAIAIVLRLLPIWSSRT